jgi:hypothetical protein
MPISRIEPSASRTGNDAIYGTGMHGDVTISGTVTLTSDRYYNTLNVPLGNVLLTNGFRIFVKNTATINGVVGIGAVTGNTPRSTNGTLSSHGTAMSTGTLAGNMSSAISYRIGGQGGGGTSPGVSALPDFLVRRVESLTGVSFDAVYGSITPVLIAGGSRCHVWVW